MRPRSALRYSLLLLAFAASAAIQAQPKTLAVCTEAAPEGFDPARYTSGYTFDASAHPLYNALAAFAPGSTTVIPALAESWDVSADGLVYTFRLRQGVRFHDGAALDASAVRFSWERSGAPGSTNKARKALFDNIASIGTPDAHTVVLTLHRPDAHLLFRLGENTAVVLHPDSTAQAATDPVGTGPYRVAGWERGQRITLVKAESHRHAAQVRMERAVYRFLHDLEAQDNALRAGEIDVLFNFATQTVRRFQDNSHYQVLIGSSGGKGMLALNHRSKPLDDVRVRRAITHAIDREGFIRSVLDGRGVAIGSHFSPADAGYLHLANMYPHDPERARALLKSAGVATPLRLTLALPPAPYAHEGGPVIAQDLARVGIVAELQRLSWEQWLNGPFKGQFDMTLINHVEPLDYRIYADPGYYFGYDSPAFRDLVQRHGAADNARERQLLWAELQRQLARDAVNAWIFAPQVGTVVRKGLRGTWMNYPIFVHDIAAMWWE